VLRLKCTVVSVEDTAFRGVKRVFFEAAGGGLKGFFEYPADKLKDYGVSFSPGEDIIIALDERKSEQYRDYVLYMSGIVYYSVSNRLRISIGGLIFELTGDVPSFELGKKIYIGIMK